MMNRILVNILHGQKRDELPAVSVVEREQFESLYQQFIADCPDAAKRPRIAKRVLALYVSDLSMSQLADVEERNHLVRQAYKQTFGSSILIMIFLQFVLPMLASIVSKWILAWWEKHHPTTELDDQKALSELNHVLLFPLSIAAKAWIAGEMGTLTSNATPGNA